MSLPSRLLGANPSIQVSTLLSGSLSTPSAKQAFVPPTNFESIASFTASSSFTVETFTSIPQNYVSLQLRILSRRSNGVGHVIGLNFNGDQTSNYWFHNLQGIGTTNQINVNSSASARINAFVGHTNTNLSNQFGAGIIDIHDYASSTKKTTIRCFGGCDTNASGGGMVSITSGVWNVTDAITSIRVDALGDTMVAGTTFALYGIKGA